jgi:predicted amidophosphoribosyltransferase
MAYQWLEQKLPIPEYLIPLPVTFWHRHKLGFDPHLLLAKELGKIFSVPVAPCLKKIFDAPHFFTQGELRHRLIAQKKKESILCDHRILLVAPQLDDTLFRSAGTALKEFFPGQVDALAFAIDLE